MIDDDAQRKLLEKFKRNIDDIIQRYKDVDDTYDSVVNLSQSEEMDTLELQDVSFIKKGRRISRSSGVYLSLGEIYSRLCFENDFEDALVHLCWNDTGH